MGKFPKIPLHVMWFIRLERALWKEWEFGSFPLIENGNGTWEIVNLDMGYCVDRTLCMDDDNMPLGVFFQRDIVENE